MSSRLLAAFVVVTSCVMPCPAVAQNEALITAGTKSLPLPGESFRLNEQDAFVIAAKEPAVGSPWVFYAPTLKNLPGKEEAWMLERFLKAGIGIAGIDVGESYGSPKGRAGYDALFNYLVKTRGFSSKPVLLARSRGGLMLYSWAAQNPSRVGGIAGIYPVCNLESYPGLNRACGAFEMTEKELKAELTKHNPIDQLASLAKARVPIHHIHGDSDKVVPNDKNSAIVAQRYGDLGGSMSLEVVKGQGHNMWSGWFQSQKLTDFVIANATRAAKKQSKSKHPVPESDLWLTYPGHDGPGRGKHVVLIAAEQEYRCEQSMPMLAKVLSHHHGFDCTVLFSVNDKGEVDPTLPAPFKKEERATRRHRIPGLKYLADADCVIWLSRFMQLGDDDMQHFHDYFDSGKPLIALRTANHGFWGGSKYKVDGKRVELRDMLGGVFMGHHGGWHREATSGIIVDEHKAHPVLTGVHDIWGTSDVYRCHQDDRFPFPDDCTKLVLGQPMVSLEPDAPANKKKEPLPIAWTKTWTGNQGRAGRILHFTMGSAEDFRNEGVRRLTVNGVYWGLGMESSIRPDSSVQLVGEYKPRKAGFNYKKLGVQPRKPAEYR